MIALSARRFEKDPATLSAGDDVFDALGIDSVQVLALLSELERTLLIVSSLYVDIANEYMVLMNKWTDP